MGIIVVPCTVAEPEQPDGGSLPRVQCLCTPAGTGHVLEGGPRVAPVRPRRQRGRQRWVLTGHAASWGGGHGLEDEREDLQAMGLDWDRRRRNGLGRALWWLVSNSNALFAWTWGGSSGVGTG